MKSENPLHTINASMELLQVGGLDPEKQQKIHSECPNSGRAYRCAFKDLLTLAAVRLRPEFHTVAVV